MLHNYIFFVTANNTVHSDAKKDVVWWVLVFFRWMYILWWALWRKV